MSTFDSAPTVRVKPTLPAAAVRRGPGLAARFSLTTAAVVAVSLFVTVVILTRTANRVALSTVRSDLQRVPAIFSSWSADAQTRFRSQVRSMASEPGTKALLDPGVSAQTRYEFVARDAPLVLEAKTVFLFDREGKVLARNDRALGEGLGQPFGGVAWVAEPLSSWQETSAVIREKDTLSFVAAAPVVAGSGDLAILDGVLAASFPLDEQAAQSLQTLTRGEVSFVVDRARAGQPTRAELSHATPGYPRAAFSDFMDRHPALVEAVFRRGETFGPFSLGSTNGTFLGLTIPIKGTTGEAYGALAVLRPLDQELQPFVRIRNAIVLVGMGVLAVASALAFHLGRKLAQPIASLAAAADAVREGRLEVALPEAGVDEVGRLASAFRGMVSELREKRALEELVGGLNQRPLGPSPTPPSAMPLVEGEVLGRRYRLTRLLGRGAMGEVYLAHDLELDEDVALKVLRPESFPDGTQAIQSVKEEIRVARRITHPNVVRVHDFGEASGVRFLTMEYVPGLTLRQVIEQEGPIALGPGLQIAKQVCRGLSAVHEAGILHRDIKPQNIMVLPSGLVKLMDFGIALVQQSQRQAEEVAGTPLYMSPEQLASQPLDARSDLYALGATLYEMLTGKPPFTGSLPEVVALHLRGAPAPLSHLRPGLPEVLQRIVMACLAKEPSRRPASARDLYQSLLRVSLQEADLESQ